MSGLQSFQPDAEYCVYCHAPAAGLCATCGALCCGDCVELVMGVTVQRATCHSCLREGRAPAGTKTFLQRGAMIGAVIALVFAMLVYLV